MHVATAGLLAGLACAHAASEIEDGALRWGTYHSGLYFGIRSRTSPYHVSAGLLWATSSESSLRHECLESDRLEQYGWREHDGRTYGRQSIRDQHNNLLLDTTFLKPPTSPTTFATRSWAARIATSQLRADDALPALNSLYFYIDLGCEDDSPQHPCRRDTQQGATWTVRPPTPCRQQPSDGKSCVEMELISEHANDQFSFHARYQVHFHGSASDMDMAYHGDSSWSVVNIKKALEDLASRQAIDDASPQVDPSPQLSNRIAPSSTLAVVLVRYPPSRVQDVTLHLLYDEQVEADTSPVVVFDSLLPSFHAAFTTKFAAAFPTTSAFSAVGQAALSNLIGGIGYFYGSTVLQEADGAVGVTPARSLFTAVPSRSFFPRGFLWDEGFHQLGIIPFDPDVAVQVVDSWLNLMDGDGYISREQIRGTLAEARVPAEFITQFTTHANPPTLLLSVDKLLSHIVGTPILDSWWPKLQRWFEWYRRTQAGPEPNTFRWRGRDVHDGKLMPNTLSSGLDDYPRASHPSEDERHVDLAAWMIKGSAVLAKVAKAVGDDAKASSYDSLSLSFLSTMDKLHWDTATSLYFDYGLHSDDGIFEDHIVIRCQNPSTGDRHATTGALAPIPNSSTLSAMAMEGS
ncbi:hypothetical protein, variant 1 [Aphanomyces invadans]|uniref:Mannosyl-oligosaccharide glucosidase n=1 Tax=Aphanomyces invadans TaxID=157072 RepID=A0A024U5I8_9STRA|nr:hypothetical protein, variant 1 [Aphanomyces invadans]ETW01470.1 hypothetical protein, variant 1 [Aphanomyces invadans]|eukprot:XP_008870468.1 hypothetical protein, variant 1 [Aphanomyces invadans]